MRARAIEETRRAFDARGRRAWQQHRVRPPEWCGPEDPLWSLYEAGALERLFRGGSVVWGVVVQANTYLYERGPEPHPAMLLYGLDPALDDELPALRDLACSLYALKETHPREPGAASFARLITDEAARGLVTPLPDSLSRGFTLWTTSTMIHREALPRGYLAAKALPLLVVDRPRPMSLVVPHEYWSDRLRFEWDALAPAASDVI